MSQYYIRGIQQVGVGVENLEEAWKWYIKFFGADIKVFDDDAVAEFMLPYTGNQPQKRRAVLALNMQGGGGFEIWQYKGRKPQAPTFDIQLGDLGINYVKIKCKNIEQTFDFFQKENQNITEIQKDPIGNKSFFVTDPWNNTFQLVESDAWFSKEKNKHTGLVGGAVIGVPDIDGALKVYKDILGYDTTLFDETGEFPDFSQINGNSKIRRVLLKHSEDRVGGFGALFGATQIELIQCLERTPKNIFENRFWGDLGFIHICFDVQGMDALREKCTQTGHPFTVDSSAVQEGKSFDMGDSAGFFSYIEDNGTTLIEFVEGHRLPLVKAIGWELDFTKRHPTSPIPRWILKAMSLKRVKNII
jgi:catechol 2,3-dioxygenase-like lactoylglutathione lyase family enzyme